MRHYHYRHYHRPFPFPWFLFGIIMLFLFGWKLFLILPLLMIVGFWSMWGITYSGRYSAYYHDEGYEKPKRKRYDEDDDITYL